MTASLPADRLRILRDACGLEVFPATPAAFTDLMRQSEAPRYRVSTTTVTDAHPVARAALAAGQKVLWVVNTVRRCQEIARTLRAMLPDEVTRLCYHSQFRRVDRRDRHNAVIHEFRRRAAPVIAITTQVCEMSLDLDADVLITELAPVSALIQRMGRCCREPLPRPGRIGQVYVYPPPDPVPYERWETEAAGTFLAALEARGAPLSHGALADYLATMEVADPYAEGGYTGFLDAGPYAMSAEESFREGEDFAVECVLDVDVPAYLTARATGDTAADGFVVPVPRRFARENPRLGRFLREAPARQYDPDVGFHGEGARRGP
jgi:CRISPR-associated endonuclease/helicase Cas3